MEFFAADARGSLPKSANGDAGAAAAGPAGPADALGPALAERSLPVADPVVFRRPDFKEIESESAPRFPFFRCAPCTSDPCTTSCSTGPIPAETAAAAFIDVSEPAAALSEVDGPPLSYRITAEDRPPIYLSALIDDVCKAGVSQEEARKIVMAEWQSVVAKGSQGQFLATLEACSPERRKWLGHELAAAAKKKTQQ